MNLLDTAKKKAEKQPKGRIFKIRDLFTEEWIFFQIRDWRTLGKAFYEEIGKNNVPEVLPVDKSSSNHHKYIKI